jgi:hypothetical protein
VACAIAPVTAEIAASATKVIEHFFNLNFYLIDFYIYFYLKFGITYFDGVMYYEHIT